MKRELKIAPIEFPKYSPDLNPLDFCLWSAIQDRMDKHAPKRETIEAYKARLRRTALSLPPSLVRKAVRDIPVRAALVVKAEGGHISKD